MTAVDHDEMKRLAEGAKPYWGAVDIAFGGNPIAADLVMPFAAEISPAVVLALLSEIEGLKAERDAANHSATMWSRCVGEMAVIGEDWKERAVAAEAALRTQAPDSWRPIETAPKDGTNILAYEDGAVTVLFWDEERGSWFHPYKGGKTRWPDITHWMPLPAAPALRPQTAESGK